MSFRSLFFPSLESLLFSLSPHMLQPTGRLTAEMEWWSIERKKKLKKTKLIGISLSLSTQSDLHWCRDLAGRLPPPPPPTRAATAASSPQRYVLFFISFRFFDLILIWFFNFDFAFYFVFYFNLILQSDFAYDFWFFNRSSTMEKNPNSSRWPGRSRRLGAPLSTNRGPSHSTAQIFQLCKSRDSQDPNFA